MFFADIQQSTGNYCGVTKFGIQDAWRRLLKWIPYVSRRSAAMYALKEAMRTAHEANDAVCLQHAQAWLYRLDENTEASSNFSLGFPKASSAATWASWLKQLVLSRLGS